MRSLKYLLPALLFAVLVAFLLRGLSRDPREIPSPLIGKPAPAFVAPLLAQPDQSWSPKSMHGRAWLLNVWASWCVPCLVEHPLLVELARDRVVPIVGLNYKDDPKAATAWLAKHGDPFEQVVADRSGSVAFDYGVYGVPETFLIDRDGTIRFKHIGPLTQDVVRSRLMPLLREVSR